MCWHIVLVLLLVLVSFPVPVPFPVPGSFPALFPCLFVCQVSVNFSHSARYPSVALQTTSIWAAAALVAVAARCHYYNVPAQPSDSLQEQPPRPPSPPTSAAAPPGQQWLLPLMDCHDRRHSEKMICRHIICLYIAALSRCNNLVIWSLIDLFNTWQYMFYVKRAVSRINFLEYQTVFSPTTDVRPRRYFLRVFSWLVPPVIGSYTWPH